MNLYVTHLTKHNFLKSFASLLSKLSSMDGLLISSVHFSLSFSVNFATCSYLKDSFFFLPSQNLPPNQPMLLSLCSFWPARYIHFFLWSFQCKSVKLISMIPDAPFIHRPDYGQQRCFSVKRKLDILFLLHINSNIIMNGCFEAKRNDVFVYIPDIGRIFWLKKEK